MRRNTRLALGIVVALVWLVPSAARAVSIRDLVELSRAGLSDDILLAVLEADPTIFDLDADTIIEMRRAGLSERVIAAMLRSGRASARDDLNRLNRMDDLDQVGDQGPLMPPESFASDPYATQPEVVVIGGRSEARPEPTVMYVPVPVFGFTHHVLQSRGRPAPDALNTQRGFGRFMNDGFRLGAGAAPAQPSGGEQVYWGWGGQRRPGSWNEAGSR